MFLIIQHQPNNNNDILYYEFICKVVYIPAVITKFINELGIITFFDFIGTDFDTVVKCHCRDMDIAIRTFGESDSLNLVNLGLNDLHKIFGVGNTKLASTLFIINGITFEALTFLLLSYGIKLHGGSHTRRHLLQPLELKLAFAVKDLPGYVDYYIKSFIDQDTTNFFELELKHISKFKSLKGEINNNYFNSDTFKMFLNPEFQDLVLKFKQLLKIAYKCRFSRDVLYTLFLRNYSLDLNSDNLLNFILDEFLSYYLKSRSIWFKNCNEKKEKAYQNTLNLCNWIIKEGYTRINNNKDFRRKGSKCS